LPGIFFEIKGSGDTLLLIPGWTLNHHIWDDIVPILEKEFELILPDLRGTGKSPSGGKACSVESDAEDLAEIIGGRRKVHVVAHSRGVKVFLALAGLLQGTVAKSVLIGSAGFWPVNERLDAEVQMVKNMAFEEGVEKAVERMPQIIKLGPVSGGVENVRKLKRARDGYKGLDLVQGEGSRKHDYREMYEILEIPVVFVAGEKERLLPDIREAAGWRKENKLHVIPGVGHFPMIEAPDLLAGIIMDFVKGERNGS